MVSNHILDVIYYCVLGNTVDILGILGQFSTIPSTIPGNLSALYILWSPLRPSTGWRILKQAVINRDNLQT